MNRFALALTIAAISTSAAAQSSRKQPTWDDLLKPLDVKTNPNVPIAPTAPVPPVQPAPPVKRAVTAIETYRLPERSTTPPQTISTGLLDACIIEATGRLPKADGLRVTNSSYEFDHSYGKYDEVWRVSVSVKLGDRQAQYEWYCHIDPRGSAKLKTTFW